jgi:NAD(P)H-flavin reductase
MRIDKITDEAPGVRTFRLVFNNPEEAAKFDFKAGIFLPGERQQLTFSWLFP